MLTQHAWDLQESIKSCETEEKVQFRLRIFLIAKAELGTRQFFAASRLNCSVSWRLRGPLHFVAIFTGTDFFFY